MWPSPAPVRPQFYRENHHLQFNYLKIHNIYPARQCRQYGNSFLAFTRIPPHFPHFRRLLFPKKQPERRILTVAQRTQFYGGLIYYGLPGSALAKCSCIIADTLEEYGHSVDQFSARANDVIALACDQYRLVLRMGEQPEAADSLADSQKPRPGQQRVEISLQPNFPTHCDRELSEMLMAVILYRLVPALAAEQVEWMHPSATLTRSQFLNVFSNIRSMQPQPQPSADDRFAPIEETAAELELHCSQMQTSLHQSPIAAIRPASYQRFTAWAGGLLRNSEHHFFSLVAPLTVCTTLVMKSGAL